jgi:hypothetical protein
MRDQSSACSVTDCAPSAHHQTSLSLAFLICKKGQKSPRVTAWKKLDAKLYEELQYNFLKAINKYGKGLGCCEEEVDHWSLCCP